MKKPHRPQLQSGCSQAAAACDVRKRSSRRCPISRGRSKTGCCPPCSLTASSVIIKTIKINKWKYSKVMGDLWFSIWLQGNCQRRSTLQLCWSILRTDSVFTLHSVCSGKSWCCQTSWLLNVGCTDEVILASALSLLATGAMESNRVKDGQRWSKHVCIAIRFMDVHGTW